MRPGLGRRRNRIARLPMRYRPTSLASSTTSTGGWSAREPTEERTEHQPDLRGERNVRGHAYEDAEC
jgi:hypothetical protein